MPGQGTEYPSVKRLAGKLDHAAAPLRPIQASGLARALEQNAPLSKCCSGVKATCTNMMRQVMKRPKLGKLPLISAQEGVA